MGKARVLCVPVYRLSRLGHLGVVLVANGVGFFELGKSSSSDSFATEVATTRGLCLRGSTTCLLVAQSSDDGLF